MSDTETLIKALRILARDIESGDGVANAAIAEAADRLEEQQKQIDELRKAVAKQNENISQTCGKALGYPWFKDDPKNFPGATEACGVCVGEHVAETIVTELAKEYAKAKERIKRLEEAGDAMHWAFMHPFDTANESVPDAWRKAKEAQT